MIENNPGNYFLRGGAFSDMILILVDYKPSYKVKEGNCKYKPSSNRNPNEKKEQRYG